MQNSIIFITIVIFVTHIHSSTGFSFKHPINEKVKRSNENFLPNEHFTVITNEKLDKLKDLADTVHDPKLQELYRTVNHYVQLARKNDEHVLWKYDVNQQGLVLTLRQNLNRILYYGK